MDPSLQSLLSRLEHLSGDFRELRDGVQQVIKIADASPEMALTRARKVLEYVIRDVYLRRINEPPGTRPLENLLQRLVKDGYFPDRLDAYASTIRKLGNVGTHGFGEQVAVTDVYQSLAQLLPILEWYFEVERPEALNGQSASPQLPRPVENRLTERTVAVPFPIAMIPKGLRSFDANDADFFIDLLPGPRDKDGLPESIRFWKNRIEINDIETFTMGVIYGPSGCGKSSLVKAGLLPRLASQILPVYVEATADDTEARVLKGLRKQCPGVSADQGLAETVRVLRGVAGSKVVIVIDQFEQWLHAHRTEQDTALAQALRQCDGEHVQCIVLVRDDFWVALSRFMTDLHIELVHGQNTAMVDLFDPMHARNVLAAFGRAFGRLSEPLLKDQEVFLDQAIAGLAQDGRLICVRLAVFAEMIKGKPWLPATLQDVGGTEGIGVNFLEETFRSRSASPRHRLHEPAAREVLKALLPEVGTDIKGHMQSRNDLLQASGYQGRPQEFDQLLRILDTELRLITPTDPKRLESESASDSQAKYFQLTHDYLVHSLREWLTQKQKETRRGRAELRLAERTALWNHKSENRHLPSLWEYLNIRLLTNGAKWTGLQRAMMKKAGRTHGVRASVAGALLLVVLMSGLAVSRQIQENRQADYAASLVEQLLKADIAEVPGIVQKLEVYRRSVNPLLNEEEGRAKEGTPQKLHLALSLLPEATHVNLLRDQLVLVTPSEFPVVRNALLPHQKAIVESLWAVALDPKRQIEQRFQAGCALATYTPEDSRWKEIDMLVADHLVSRQAADFLAWREALRPAKGALLKPLGMIYRNKSQERQPRIYATETMADYARDSPGLLFDLLADAEQFQFQPIFGKLAQHKEQAVALAQKELEKQPGVQANEDEKEALAQRQANAAVALYRLQNYETVWPLFKYSPDPRVRSYLIHRLSPLGGDPQAIIQRLDSEPDLTVRRALVLTLGEFTDTQLSSPQRQMLIEKLLAVYENEADAGLHGAAQWLLRKWGQGDRMQATVEGLKTSEVQMRARDHDKRRWYVNTQGQTFVILDAEEFVMGSPVSEPNHYSDETQHRCHLGRRLAISTMEVTRSQFQRFQAERPETQFDVSQWVKTDDSPETGITWYEAAWYCNWLSEQEGIPKDQWCYEPNEEGKYGPGMKAKDNYLELVGYRLPTEAEWEYACRAGTVTSRYYGLAEALLPKYAWYLADGQNRLWPVGSVKPNDFGIFDMLGNAFEWCSDRYVAPKQAEDVVEDAPTTQPVLATDLRMLRGGAFSFPPGYTRAAGRVDCPPDNRGTASGVRPARTYPLYR